MGNDGSSKKNRCSDAHAAYYYTSVTSVPSALLLFRYFTVAHGLLHSIMQNMVRWVLYSYDASTHPHGGHFGEENMLGSTMHSHTLLIH